MDREAEPKDETIDLPSYTKTATPADTDEEPVPSVAQPPNPPEWTPPPQSKLFKAALPTALLVGAGITAATTYAIVKRVQHLIATAAVDSDPSTWTAAARTQVYDPCYLGCADCSDPAYAWNACQRTVQLPPAAGVSCDANGMWNWRDRYPAPCLAAMGDVLRAEALERLRQSYRNQLAIVILTVLGGVVGAVITYGLVRAWARKRDNKAALPRAGNPPPPYIAVPPSGRGSGGAGRRRRWKMMFVVKFFGGRALAYPCVGREPASDQFFVSPNGTIAGVVHGWFSNCYDREYCYPTCTLSCNNGGQCTEHCTTTCYTVTYTDKSPRQFVQDVAPKVEACGFRLVNAVQEGATVRVANGNLERNFWVKISVNGYNVTSSEWTDDMVVCLHDIGGR